MEQTNYLTHFWLQHSESSTTNYSHSNELTIFLLNDKKKKNSKTEVKTYSRAAELL